MAHWQRRPPPQALEKNRIEYLKIHFFHSNCNPERLISPIAMPYGLFFRAYAPAVAVDW